MRPWLELPVWEAVASELGEHQQAGLERLLTEDVVRFSAGRALVAQGCDPSQLRLEWPHPLLRRSRIDLVVGTPPQAFVELKYPREPHEQNAAWTMALGEVLKDLYRLSQLPTGDRLFVYVETARLHRYMAGAAIKYGLNLDVEQVVLDPKAARTLPPTAAQIIGLELLARRVTAKRLHVLPIGEQLRLSVYLVDGAQETDQASKVSLPSAITRAAAGAAAAAIAAVDADADEARTSLSGVRGEIHRAVRAVLARSGSTVFRLDEVVRELQQAGSRYPESTVRTMIASHLCANAPDHAAVTYRDFKRIERGVYRPI